MVVFKGFLKFILVWIGIGIYARTSEVLVYVAPNMYNIKLENCKKKEQIHKDTG